jgi:coenzyme PQQ precursor peptide PqqA
MPAGSASVARRKWDQPTSSRMQSDAEHARPRSQRLINVHNNPPVLLTQNGVVERLTHYRRIRMTWTTPTLVEICIGLEINGYLPAEF